MKKQWLLFDEDLPAVGISIMKQGVLIRDVVLLWKAMEQAPERLL